MGIRLYPLTKDPRNLEKLAHVPFGTYERWERLNAALDQDSGQGPEGEKALEAFFSDVEVHKLDRIVLSGFGRMKVDRGISGEERDPAKVRELLKLQGWQGTEQEVELMEGVFWC